MKQAQAMLPVLYAPERDDYDHIVTDVAFWFFLKTFLRSI
jgi:hypothetical protein